MLSINPGLSNSTVVSLLERNADDIGIPGFDTSYGWGRVNAYRAVSAVAAGGAADTTPPAVSISSPTASATLSGTIQVQGTATDNVGVSNIELWIDGQLSTSGTASPFSLTWNTAGTVNGSHTLTVKAYDAAGNIGQASVTVGVNNPIVPDTQPPTDTIMSPSNGSLLGVSTTVSVAASDNVAVSQVTVYIDGVLQYTGTAAPYSFKWNTKKATAGSHTITSKAWDKAGNLTLATPVTVSK
jgi:hypothetical protein